MRARATFRLRFAAALLSTFACLAGFSLPAEAIRLTGRIDFQAPDGGGGQMWFNCDGENPCRGTYMAIMHTPVCSDVYGRLDTITITGLDLSRSGPISGSVTVTAIEGPDFTRSPDGWCEALPGAFGDFTTSFTGTFDGSRVNLVFPASAEVSLTGSASVVTRLAHVTGTMSGSGASGNMSVTFSCDGEDPCTGTATLVQLEQGCSNTYTLSDRFAIMGMNLSQPGSFSGGLIFRRSNYNTTRNPNGICSFSTDPSRDGGEYISGSWNGTSGTFTMPIDEYTATANFTASFTNLPTSTRAPVFEMTVTSNITPTVSSATANIQYRPADVGRTGSVFAFAVAPRNLVRPASDGAALVVGKTGPTKAGEVPVACVLAQLNGSGQLQEVSASGLQAYVTGVLSSQGQSVNVINGVATANIAGSTFYVGYGSDASAMMSGGVNRSVVTVPGAQVCQPKPPQTGWWWNQAEDGRGYTIESTGEKLFFAAYLYDISGRSTWYIAAGPTSIDGSLFVGDLESYTNGQTLSGAFRSPVRPPVLNGKITLAFNDELNGTLVWPGGTVPITRMEWGVGGVNAVPQENQPENGWWLSGLDDGRGFFIEWQAGIGFMAGFMYDDTGAPVWYIAANPKTSNARLFSSQWEKYINGQTLTGAYHPPVRPPTYVGPATIQFSGPANAVMTMPGGAQVTLSRYRF